MPIEVLEGRVAREEGSNLNSLPDMAGSETGGSPVEASSVAML